MDNEYVKIWSELVALLDPRNELDDAFIHLKYRTDAKTEREKRIEKLQNQLEIYEEAMPQNKRLESPKAYLMRKFLKKPLYSTDLSEYMEN